MIVTRCQFRFDGVHGHLASGDIFGDVIQRGESGECEERDPCGRSKEDVSLLEQMQSVPRREPVLREIYIEREIGEEKEGMRTRRDHHNQSNSSGQTIETVSIWSLVAYLALSSSNVAKKKDVSYLKRREKQTKIEIEERREKRVITCTSQPQELSSGPNPTATQSAIGDRSVPSSQ